MPERVVGRGSELKLVDVLLHAARRGQGGSLFLEGEPGIGKTTLVDEASDRAAAQGFTVRRARGAKLEREFPFGLMRAAMQTRLGTGDDAAGTPGLVVMEAMIDEVEALALAGPVLLVIDDLQWADDASLAVVRRVVERASTLPLAVLLAARPFPRPAGLASLVDTVEASGGKRHHVAPLTPDDVMQLLERVLGDRPSPELCATVERANGNPLFVAELARRPDLTADDAGRSLRDVIATRLRDLSPACRDTITAASLLGRSFSVRQLAVVRETPVSELSPLLGEALTAGVLEEAGADLAFHHDVVQEAVYLDVPLSVRRGLHREAAARLSAVGAPAAAVAAQFSLGAEPGDREAVEWLRRAAHDVVHADPATAAGLLRRAAALCEDHDSTRFQLLHDAATALVWAGRLEEAESAASEVLDSGAPLEVERRARGVLGWLVGIRGRPAESLAHFDTLIASASGEELAELLLMRARPRAHLADVAGAIEDTERALAMAPGIAVVESLGYSLLGFAAMMAGDLERGRALLARAAAAEDSGEWSGWMPYARRTSLPLLALASVLLDRFDDADGALTAARQRATRSGTRSVLPVVHFVGAFARYVRGDWDDALSEAEAATALAEEIDQETGRALGAALVATIAVRRDDRDTVERILPAVEHAPLTGENIMFVLWARATTAVVLGDTGRAREVLEQAWSAAASLNVHAIYDFMGLLYVRLLVEGGRRGEARDAAALVEGVVARAGEAPSQRAIGLLARGVAERDAALAVEAVEVLRGMRRPVDLAEACEDAAGVLAEHGDREHAVALLIEAQERYEALGAAADLRRVDAALRRLGVRSGAHGRRQRPATGWAALTPTEERVVALVAEGLTNRAVAERLYISPRTVDRHLAHVFQKLGVRSRTELARITTRQKEAVSPRF